MCFKFNVENKTTLSEDRYTYVGIIMCSELCAMQSFTVQHCNADNHKNDISGIAFVKEKALPQQSTQLKCKAKGKLSTEILQEQMLGQFSSNFQN